MNWIPDLAAALPAPRDDEPPELRRRILAELRDHLECAFQRELVLTGDAEEAIRRVRAKFGDPVQLARKLWFEALREKIMSQRLMLVCVGMLTAACMAMGIFSWKTAEQSALATQAIVERLDQLVQSSAKQKSLDWVDLKIRLATEGGGGPPPEGFQVRISNGGANLPTIEVSKSSPRDGELEFGLLNPGRYNLTIQAPWGESTGKTIYVRAGESAWVETVVCPSGPIQDASVQFDVEWPDDLKRESLGLLIQAARQSRRFGNEPWNQFEVESIPGISDGVQYFLIDSKGNVRPYSFEDSVSRTSAIYLLDMPDAKAAVPHSAALTDRTAHLKGLDQSVISFGAVLLARQTRHPDQTESDSRKLAPIVRVQQKQDLTLTPDAVNRCKVDLPEQLIKQVRQNLRVKATEG